MNDLVNKLWATALAFPNAYNGHVARCITQLMEAADEIERLQAELKELRELLLDRSLRMRKEIERLQAALEQISSLCDELDLPSLSPIRLAVSEARIYRDPSTD